MPKKGRTQRKFNLRRVRIAASLPVGALNTLVVGATQALHDAATEQFRAMSLDVTWSWDEGTTVDSGLTFGVAHSDYTSAEIEQCLEAQASINRGNKIAQEQANRLVRVIGTFVADETTTGGTFNDGKKMKTRLNWLMITGETLNCWFRNGSGTIYTTGSDILVNGNMWIKDGV